MVLATVRPGRTRTTLWRSSVVWTTTRPASKSRPATAPGAGTAGLRRRGSDGGDERDEGGQYVTWSGQRWYEHSRHF